jgi:hypothetical protein
MATSPGSLSAALVRGRVARFTLLDDCGMPEADQSMYVTEGIITVNSTKNVDAGDVISVRQMDGTIGVYEPGQASLTNFTIAINLIKVDPGALVMLTGDPAVLNAAGDTIVGFEELALQRMLQKFGMEVWTDTAGNFCQAGGKVTGYMLYPMIGQAYVTIDNISDKEVTATINGMSYGNPEWGEGPYGGTTPVGVTPGPVAGVGGVQSRLLAPVDPNAHRHFELTSISPPDAFTVPGPQSIILPDPY